MFINKIFHKPKWMWLLTLKPIKYNKTNSITYTLIYKDYKYILFIIISLERIGESL
jgi:hypothetical protein